MSSAQQGGACQRQAGSRLPPPLNPTDGQTAPLPGLHPTLPQKPGDEGLAGGRPSGKPPASLGAVPSNPCCSLPLRPGSGAGLTLGRPHVTLSPSLCSVASPPTPSS